MNGHGTKNVNLKIFAFAGTLIVVLMTTVFATGCITTPWGALEDDNNDTTAKGPTAVNLRSAADFAILGGSTITNTGAATMIHGDVGLYPGTSVSGLLPVMVTGTIHANDSSAAQAQLDLTTAFNDAAGRTLAPVSVAGNLGGQTLAPGLYKSTSGLDISSGDLTLSGSSNDVWIFQIASTLTLTEGRQVILTGGALASNVFWQVGTSATLGTNSTFAGTIMADQSVTLLNGATLDGRALTRIGAITLDTNTVRK